MTVQAEGLTEDTEDLKIDEPVGINDLPPEVRKSPKRVKKVEKISKQIFMVFFLWGEGGGIGGELRGLEPREISSLLESLHTE